MQTVIKTKFSSLVGNPSTTWQYCSVEKLIQQKAEYDKFVAEQKLLNTVINAVHPITGEHLVEKRTQE